jgi:hypothetical protein
VAKRTPENNRRKLIEEQRKKARAKERRTTVLTIVLSTVVGLALIGSAVYFGRKDKKPDVALASVGVSAEAAGCSAPKEEPLGEGAVGEDAVKHTSETVDYPLHPPTSGRHNPSPLPVGAKKFYSREDNPPPERAVHNLEHAYVVVWYDNKASDAQLTQLEDAANAADGKFLVVPWTRADFPDDKHVVLTAWTEKQECSGVSGAVFQEFMDTFGGTKGKAPEKGAF